MKHVIRILDRTGDTETKWSPDNLVEVKAAEEIFGALQAQKYHLFDASAPQDTKNEMTVFDPEAKEIVAFGQPVGG